MSASSSMLGIEEALQSSRSCGRGWGEWRDQWMLCSQKPVA